MQYGVNDNTEVYGSLGALWRKDRYYSTNNYLSESSGKFSEVNLGLNHILVRDGRNPFMVGVVESSVIDKSHGKNSYGRSWFVGISTYKALDPIVFSLNGGYRFNFGSVNGRRLGNYWLIRPGVSFAANDRVVLNGRFQWVGRQGDKVNGQRISSFETNTYTTLGVGYALSQQTSINADVQWNISGNEGMSATFLLQHRF